MCGGRFCFSRKGRSVEPTQQDLKDAGCWFDSDRAGTPEMTAFKREARWRQHRWAVDTMGIRTFGTHRGRQIDPDVPAEEICNGTKLVPRDAEAGSNFLNPTIHKIARDRAEAHEDHQTLDATRLHRGPAVLHADGLQPVWRSVAYR
ncbi:hypothetical protein [Nostocoides sp. HKS02]|uniref:hypothetical protein n=1 Tax=Nostocoides sp. HKS02 TaxID=1813880 RepID=UPI00351AC37F